MIGRGRVISREQAEQATPIRPSLPAPAGTLRGRVAPKQVVEASLKAEQLLGHAREEAARIVEAAQRGVADLKLRAEAEARAEASAKLAAHALVLESHEAKADERALARSVALARLLAERLLGESLRVAPEQVIALARQALLEARGARRVAIVAHPEDARLLEGTAGSLGLALESLRVVADPARARGSLRIETEIGVLDADLAPQLDRLARRLRESLSHGE